MAFESLSERLSAAFKKLRGRGRLTEKDIQEAMREVRMALLEADVNYRVARDFIKTVSARAVGTVVRFVWPFQYSTRSRSSSFCRRSSSSAVNF